MPRVPGYHRVLKEKKWGNCGLCWIILSKRAVANMAAEISVEMHEFHAKLKKIGWNISIEEIKGCIKELGQRDRTVENIAKWALNCDLKEIGLKVLTDEVKRGQVKLVEGPLVLQIQKIRNISAPKVNEESGAAPRLLKLQLTDGHTTCFALEHSLIQKLSLSTPPGTKIRLKGTVPLLCGFMLLESRQVEVLGGKVEKLIVKWETHKSVSKQRANPGLPSDDGPPLFIAFDPKTSSVVKRTAASKPGHQNTNNSFSTQESNFNKKDDNKKENVAFEHSREQRILTAKHQRQSNPTQSESKTSSGHQVPGYQRNQQHSSSDGNEKRVGEDLAVKASGTKQQAFGPNKSNVRDAKFSDKDNGEKYVKKDSYARRPGSHKGGRHNDDISDEYSTSKPSEGTLWDFLETKLPSKGSKTENVKPMHSTVDRVEKGENQNNRQPSSQRDSQYRGQHENQQQQEKGNLGKGGHQDIRDGHRGNQDVHRQHERSGQVRNKKVLDEHKKSDQSRNQARSQQKQDHQIQDRYVDQHKKTAEGSSSQNSKEKKQVPEKKDDKDNNRRNDTRFHNKSQQPELKYNNQSGRSTKGSGRQDNQREDNYRKDFPKYDQKAEGSESTYKITRGEDRAVNYRTKDHKGKKGGGVLTDQNDRQGEIEQNVHVNKKEAGMANKSVQQSHGKQNEHYAATPRRDVQQYKEHADLSEKEKYNAAKKTVNNHHRDQSERYKERRLGDPRNESRKQHWWKEGEDCMAFRAEHRQYYLARIMKVEVRSRSCAVIFHDTGRQEIVNWSNLFPLDMQASNDNTFQFHESPSPYPSTAPQDRYIQQAPSFTPGHHAIQASEMRQRSQRPTQAFYRPPMRGTKE